MYIYIYIYIHTYVYIYIYIHIRPGARSGRPLGGRAVGRSFRRRRPPTPVLRDAGEADGGDAGVVRPAFAGIGGGGDPSGRRSGGARWSPGGEVGEGQGPSLGAVYYY